MPKKNLRDYLFYENENGQIYCGDSTQLIKLLPKKSVDIVITDPPYGIGLDYKNDIVDDAEYIKKLNAVWIPEILENQTERIAITCGIINIHYYPIPKWILCWSYWPSTNKQCRYGFNQWQPVLVYGPDPYLQKGLGSRPDMIRDARPPETKFGHPCPKPLSFMIKLIDRVSIDTGETILDPFMGIGTTCVAAQKMKRRFIGIDIVEEWCRAAVKQLSVRDVL